MISLWTDTAKLPQFPVFSGEAVVDVLIVGGGMAGLLCAYSLAQTGASYLLLEADTIASGVTKNTTAKLTAQHGLVYHRLLSRWGAERAGVYLQANLQAVEDFRRLCLDNQLDCDFEDKDNYVYSLDSPSQLEAELTALARLGYPARPAADPPLPFPVAGAVCFPEQAQFHPLKFLAALAPGLHIHEHSPVRELKPGLALTPRGRVRAGKIIVASHFPYINRHGGYFIKMHQQRSYVLGLSGAKPVGGMYVDAAQDGLSFRDQGELLLLGGAGGRTGRSHGGWTQLQAQAQRFYPGCTVKYQWAAQDCITLDDMPYIGPYSRETPWLLVAAGFNKWGMTSSMVAAHILSALARERPHPWAWAFSPSRSVLHPRLAANALEAAANLLRPASRRCTHLGCALRWNREENSWDCPSHGSRFTAEGGLIENPATRDLS